MHAELRREANVRAIVLGDHQKAAHVLVEAVHDARPQHPADPGQAARAVGEQGVDQRPARVSGGRMHHQAGGLVEHQEVLVLEHDIERQHLALPVPRAAARGRAPHSSAPV